MKKTITWILLFSLFSIPSAFCQSGKGPVEVFRAMHQMPNSIARRVVSHLPSVPTAARTAGIKMMAKTYYPDLPSEGRYQSLPFSPSTNNNHARYTMYRELRPFPVTPTEPSKPAPEPTQPDTKPTSDAIQSKEPPNESDVRMPPLTEARQPSEFNISNFLDYRAYEPPFNPQVHHLEVLVATDQPGFAAYLSAEQNSRVHITAVSNGNEAISQLMTYPDKYHVILTDMHMENGNGIDVAKYVHEHHLPCYVTVVSKSSVNPRDLFQYGVDGAMSVMSSPNGESFRPASTILAYLSNMVFNKGNVFGLPKKD